MTAVPEKVKPLIGNRVSVPAGAIWISEVPRDEAGRRVWSCSWCFNQGHWGPEWRHFGSILLEDEGLTVPICSEGCAKKYDRHERRFDT